MNNHSTFITKYKPYYINDFSDNKQLVNTINTLIELDSLNILLVGDVSSGKTTLLNCIAREYYGLQKHNNLPESNTLTINNLKEQGIQYFRNEMKTFCQSRSSIHGKKKLVIIDDIDLINEQGQQVFRNYIDKYSKNIQFISVCSNIQKVIESLQSRLHIISIPRQTHTYINAVMLKIIENENINIGKPIQDYLLVSSNYSIRTLINFLEKIFIYNNNITLEDCKKICSTISTYHFDNYYNKIVNNDLTGAIDVLYNIYDYGYSVIDILDFLFHYTKTCSLIDEECKYKVIIELCKYITVFHNIHEDSIELALITNNINNLINNIAL
jgi:DNA polymerase-3 subunit gamma/tau